MPSYWSTPRSRATCGGGLIAATVLALATALEIVLIIYSGNSVFTVLERAGAYADRRLMELIGGVPGLAHHEQSDYLDQIERIRSQRWMLSGMVNATTGLLRVLAVTILSATMLATIHPALILMPLFGVVSFLVGKKTTDIWNTANEQVSEPGRLQRHLFDIATNSESGKEIRVFGTGHELLRRYRAVSDSVLSVRKRADQRSALLQALDGVVSGTVYVGAIALAVWQAVNGNATVGDVVLAIALAATVNGIVSTAVVYGTYFLKLLTLGRRFVWLEQYAAEHSGVPKELLAPPKKINTGIIVRDVSFRYPAADRPALDRVSLELPAGSVVALVGENGAGKTTLIKLLCRFYDPDSGRIEVDGVDLARMPIGQWRDRISTTYQDHVAFEFLAGETVGIGDIPHMDDDLSVRRALAAAGAGDLEETLRDGLETRLGKTWDNGVDLSGGQWQKLALGRGLMRDGALLVLFDEPTSALDPQTEHALFERFAAAAHGRKERGAVTLLVSHRFSTVKMADLIVVMHDGQITEQGTHTDLMRGGGVYAELYDLQSKSYQ